jgi:D-alanyl-D-alanine carboxypeptidase/D-alanyl-D-alanine-endopeptidase (penicillin-binding protein 4)
MLVTLLRTAALPGHEKLRPILTGLPVAGFSGTLMDRYRLPASGRERVWSTRRRGACVS